MSFKFKFILFSWLLWSISTWGSGIVLTILDQREGFTMYDPFFQILPHVNLSVYITLFMHMLSLYVIFRLGKYPLRFYKFLNCMAVIYIVRLFTIFLTNLELPASDMVWWDPITAIWSNSVKDDLFFSGHISMMVLFTIFVGKKYKKFAILLTFLMSIMILISRGHYTIDILAAPIFVLVIYKSVNYLWIKHDISNRYMNSKSFEDDYKNICKYIIKLRNLAVRDEDLEI